MNPESFLKYWSTRRLAAGRMFNILTSNYTVLDINEEESRDALDALQDFLLTHEGQLPLTLSQEMRYPPRVDTYLVYSSPLQNKNLYDLVTCLQRQEDRCGFFRNAALDLEGVEKVSPKFYRLTGTGTPSALNNMAFFSSWGRGLELEFQRLEVVFAERDEKIPFYQLEQERWAGGRDWTRDMGPWIVEENYYYLLFTYRGGGPAMSFNFPKGFGGES